MTTHIHRLLQSILALQQPNGSLPGSSPSIFGTALVATILSELSATYPIAATICQNAASYLATQQRPDGSFTYWEIGYDTQQTYPPDLDDTALATAAILQCDKTKADSNRLTQLLHLLTRAEIQEGGPYNTWCIADTAAWNDIDLGVQANIAYLLDQLGVHLPNLEILFDTAITTDTYHSAYYHLPLFLLFLISRSYQGIHRDRAIQYIKQKQSCGMWATYTETALALCALSNFSEDIASYHEAISYLENHKESDPLYIERVHNGHTTFYTNPAVSLALAVLALHCSSNKPVEPMTPTALQDQCIDVFFQHCPRQFHDSARMHIASLTNQEISRDALQLPQIFARMIAVSVSEDTIAQLSLAHLYGWIGYRIIDAALDGESVQGDLSFASYCIRSFTAIYHTLFPGAESTFFSDTMQETEVAFAREYNERMPCKDGIYTITTIPDHPVSWQKSIGHALPALALVILAGHDMQTAAFTHTKSFFASFLHARQLHDDAHDIIEDLAYGRISIPGSHVLLRYKILHPSCDTYSILKDEQELRRIFWEDCFPIIYHDIEQALDSARAHLAHMPLIDKTYCEHLLSHIMDAQNRACAERERILSFLTAFEASLPTKEHTA